MDANEKELVEVRRVLGRGLVGVEPGHAPALIEHLFRNVGDAWAEVANRYSEAEVRRIAYLLQFKSVDAALQQIHEERTK